MASYFSILCHFFLICYDPKLIPIPEGLPSHECEGYLAPPPPFTSVETEKAYISVKCINLINLQSVHRNFNTLHYNHGQFNFEEDFFKGMSVASLVFENIITIGKNSNTNLFNGIQDLKAISFVNCDLLGDWQIFKAFRSLTQLEYIYMKSVHLYEFSDEFDRNSFENVRVAEFDNLRLEIDKNIQTFFNKWKNLQMLTIVNSGLSEVEWLAGEFFNLWYLDLSNNGLTDIRPGLIVPERFPKLKYLNFNGNKIRTISQDTLPNKMWGHFSEVYMNQLCCNNKLAWISTIQIPSSFYLLCCLPLSPESEPKFIQGVSSDNFKSSKNCNL